MPTGLCNEDSCTNPAKTLGLCSTHYNRSHAATRYRMVEVSCDCCGTVTYKEARKQRWSATYCSYLCRDYTKFGPLSCRLPSRHPARGWEPRVVTQSHEPRPAECAWCGDSFLTSRSTSRFCNTTCGLRFKKAKRRGVQHGAHGTYSWSEVARLWLQFGQGCAYCDTRLPLSEVQAEHVVALSRGGSNNLTNLLPSCQPCNSDKRDLSLTEWAHDRARRGLPEVRTHWAHTDSRFKHLVLPSDLLATA